METSLDMNDLKQALKSQLELEKEGEIRISNVTQLNKQLSKRQLDKIKRLEDIHEDWEFQLTEVSTIFGWAIHLFRIIVT